jgi:hypothetical protein
MQIVYDTSSLMAAIIFGTFMYNSEDFHVRSGEGSFDVVLLPVRGGLSSVVWAHESSRVPCAGLMW